MNISPIKIYRWPVKKKSLQLWEENPHKVMCERVTGEEGLFLIRWSGSLSEQVTFELRSER